MTATQQIAIDVDGVKRTFRLRLPDSSNQPLALVIMLHGAGGTALWAEEETGWSDLAFEEGFAVAYPEALPPDRTKPPRFQTNPPLWHDGSRADLALQMADRQFIANDMLDAIVTRATIDSSRVYVTGFSNGAGMCYALATHFAQRIAAIAPAAGQCRVKAPMPVRPVPTLSIVGSDDPLTPLHGGEIRTPWGSFVKTAYIDALARWASAIGCATTPILLHDDPESRLESFPAEADWDTSRFLSLTVKGLGHHWPGGLGRLSPKLFGQPAATVNACRTIWDFFQRNSLPGRV